MSKILGAIGGFVTSGFGIGKLTGLFSKVGKIVAVLREINDVLAQFEVLFTKADKALSDGKVDSGEITAIVEEARKLIKEVRDVISAVS